MTVGTDTLIGIISALCGAAYIDMRRLVSKLHHRVSTWEHCHLRCKPEDIDIFTGE